MEPAVTKLLVSIKALLESLTKWSEQQITDMDVSDVYVELGNNFNAAVAAFASHNITMKLVPIHPGYLPSVTQSPLPLKPFHDPENLSLSLKIYEISWRPV